MWLHSSQSLSRGLWLDPCNKARCVCGVASAVESLACCRYVTKWSASFALHLAGLIWGLVGAKPRLHEALFCCQPSGPLLDLLRSYQLSWRATIFTHIGLVSVCVCMCVLLDS